MGGKPLQQAQHAALYSCGWGRGKLRIQRCLDAQAFARQRMIEAQAVRVQQQAV
jgi:hypothetical protein